MNGEQDTSNLLEKISELEHRVGAQENELNCLRSLYNALLLRVETVEGGRRANSSLAVKTSREPAKKSNSTDPNRTNSGAGPISPRNASSHGASGPVSPAAPSSARGSKQQSTPKPKPKNDATSKELVTYHKDEGIVKLWLRGRALNYYVSSEAANTYNPRAAAQQSEQKLKLEWIFGYRGKDARSNVHYLPTGEIAYFTASVVVLYNAAEQSQRHYIGHTDDVKCIAVHPDKITIATGQVTGHDKTAGKAHVRVWNSVNLSTLHVLGIGSFDRAVSNLAFSKVDGGTHLAVVDDSNEHTMSVWDWQKARCVAEAKSTTEQVCGIDFHPQDANCIVQIGRVGVLFWNFENGALSRKQGVFDKHDRPKCILALAFSETGDLVTGDSSGNLFCWLRGQNRITQASSAVHEGGVFALTLMRDGYLISAGRDRRIVRWDSSLQRAGEAIIDEQYGAIRSLSQGAGNTVLLGTARNFILQGSIGSDFRVLVSGHTDEVWGLAAHPTQHQFLSCSYDKSVTLIDALTHQVLWTKEISDSAHSAAFHPNGEVLIVGTRTGRWIVLDVLTRELISVHSDGAEQIECLEFSADGSKLALGSRDNTIYVYSVTENGRKYSRIGRCSGHSSFVTHLDWSLDGQYIQSNSGDYELLYWTAANCKQVVTPSQLRDTAWLTANCTLQFDTIGIWPDGADGTDVNGCSRANKQPLLAVADDFGKVRLFRYPAIQARAANHEYAGHSSHVTAVRFLCDDTRLLSAGGKDCSVILWEVSS